jgi:hypothetical protein
VPTPPVGDAVDAAREFLGGLNGAGVGGGRRIANGAVFLIDADGSEDAAQFDFPRVGGLALHFADPALSLLPDYGDPGAVDFHVDNGDWRTDWNRQIELECALDLDLFEPHDFGADLLGLALYGLSGYRQPGQQFQLLTARLED